MRGKLIEVTDLNAWNYAHSCDSLLVIWVLLYVRVGFQNVISFPGYVTHNDLGVFNPQPPCFITSFAAQTKNILKRIHGSTICPVTDRMDVDLKSGIVPLIFLVNITCAISTTMG